MKKNLYFSGVVKRENVLKNIILDFFFGLSSYPRLLLEVFIRKNFGERYFRLSSVLTVGIILAALPPFMSAIADWFTRPSTRHQFYDAEQSAFWPQYLTWYLFIAVFLYFSWVRRQEIKRNPSVYDFARYSFYSGKVNPVFFKIQLPGRQTDIRLVEILFEPAPFFIAGVLLWLLGQKLGILLTVCSLVYSISYVGAYTSGDNFVMDKIDEMICNEELEKAFVDDASDDETRGFRFVGRKPNDPEMRRKMLPLMTAAEEVIQAR